MNLKIFSKGLYSSWGYYAPIRTMFDCGEGAATALGNYVYAPESVFIGHGHGDHVLGLPSLVGCRNSARGDKEKPLKVFYPYSDSMRDTIDFIRKRNTRLSYELNWVEIGDGYFQEFDNNMRLEAFAVRHTTNSLGFRVLEKRSRLKAGIKPEDVKALLEKGEKVNENYWANMFTWTLDSYSYDPSKIENCAWLVADSTFLTERDRDSNTHASVEEVMIMAKAHNVKRLSLAHFSPRYDWKQIERFCLDHKAKIGFNGSLDIVLPNKVYEL